MISRVNEYLIFPLVILIYFMYNGGYVEDYFKIGVNSASRHVLMSIIGLFSLGIQLTITSLRSGVDKVCGILSLLILCMLGYMMIEVQEGKHREILYYYLGIRTINWFVEKIASENEGKFSVEEDKTRPKLLMLASGELMLLITLWIVFRKKNIYGFIKNAEFGIPKVVEKFPGAADIKLKNVLSNGHQKAEGI